MRTLEWIPNEHALELIDQRLLPGKLVKMRLTTYQQVAKAIQDMAVRGAPAIGVAAGFGMALAARQSVATNLEGFLKDIYRAAQVLRNARPTAVNLVWAIERILAVLNRREVTLENAFDEIFAEAQRMADEDVEVNQRMARIGSELIPAQATIIHHCNTGALATVDWGTALGVIRMAHEHGKRIHVLVDETRPGLQGARLTAWELSQYGIPYEIISDNAAGYFLQRGEVDLVLFGADRVAANGDVANKIGTYMLALAARENHVPVYAVVPSSSFDLSLPDGRAIPIEERPASEVLRLTWMGRRASPKGARARNPAFDITPHHLITAFVTEVGIISPPFNEQIAKTLQSTASYGRK